ncbi:TonB-dependent receptor [Acetobacter senegalensis]|uniref:TonB-dependent receptor n=1 Tax=Acetobacter senegalensis TaxID=446692 RepID=A0A149TYX7_9PROT|nr:TonB-dependent receptor [Acetobacter senegalensis]KXV58371.1 TonB-dependent receptor [Acetobacter senegalensis]MCG4259416.1 TonB-dependent receptor [Acetobacter senegalensis]
MQDCPAKRRAYLFCATMLISGAPFALAASAHAASSDQKNGPVAEKKTRSGAPAKQQPATTKAAAVKPVQQKVHAAQEEQIMVTATRRSTKLEDSPINISVIDQKLMKNERITDIRQLSSFVPGLTITDNGPGNTGNIIMRGLSSGSTSTTGNFTNNSVGVYLGEVPLYTDFKMVDIDRLEVLQGPQGTLYGLGTLAGAIRYMPHRPVLNHWSADVTGKTFGESHSGSPGGETTGTFNIPLIKDHLAFRTVVGYYNDPGFMDYNYLLKTPGVSNPQPGANSLGTAEQRAQNFYRRKDLNYDHTFTTRNQLLVQVNPNIKGYLTYMHQETRTGGQQANAAGVLGTGHYDAPWRYQEPVNRKSDLYSGEFYFNIFNFAQLVNTTAYTHQTIDSVEDNTDLLLDLDYGYQAFPNFSSYAVSHRKYTQFNEELRLVSTHKGPISWVIGGFYNNQKTDTNRHEYVPGYTSWAGIDRPDELEYASRVHTKTQERAVYGELTYHILKNLQITGGFRYFDYDSSVDGGTALPLFQTYPNVNYSSQQGSTGANGTMWKANISYRINPNIMTYFTYSTGYRVGGVNKVAPCSMPLDTSVQHACALPNEVSYKPDKTRNAELGIRGNFFHRRLIFTLAGYNIDWTNIQVPGQTQYGNVGITKNGAAAVSRGFDASVNVKVLPNFTISATYSYVDAHLTKYSPGLVTNVLGSYAGKPGDRLPGSTKNSGSIIANYTFPLDEDRNIQFNWATTYQGSIFSRVGLEGYGYRMPSYVTHRASITYNTRKWSVDLFVNNLTDQYAVTAVSNDMSSIRSRDGIAERYYAYSVLTPRTFGLEASAHF